MRKTYSIAVLLLIITSFTATAQKKNTKTETLKVYGTCEQCKHRIENTLASLGTYKANWNIATNLLTVSYDSVKLSKAKIQKKLASVGHDTEAFQADDNTYKNLPKCCYYDRYKQPELLLPIGDTMKIAAMDTIQKSVALQAPTKVHTITGVVLEEDKQGKILPLANATVRCLNTKQTSTTDSLGVFQLSCNIPMQIIVGYVGYKTDTVSITSPNEIKVILQNTTSKNLNEVVVTSKQFSSFVSTISTLNTLNISSKEITKAACCNLSESFETTPSVDVSYADAVTGIKQIQLLGLSGNYTQITTENIPEIRGLSGSYGLTFVPGPWLESVQVTKGTGSVANGYESIAGQINIEEKKPDKAEKLFVNAYANVLGRLEASVNYTKKLNDKWSSSLLTHVNGVGTKTDDNKDGFLDIPIGRQFNIINRWRYYNNKGLIAQFGIKALSDNRQAGQVDFNPSTDKLTTNKYGVGIDVQQYEAFGKIGYVFPQRKYKSIGFIFSAIDYTNNAYYGTTKYDGKQTSFYANFIYQSIIKTTEHKFRTGLSFANDSYKETFTIKNYKRQETVPGAFFEYTFTPSSKFTAIAGIRADYHNEFGLITTPRLNLKYDFTPKTNLRFSVGSGFRVANIFAENTGVFVSARQYNIISPSNNFGYGLNPEKAWNYGINFTHQFKLNNRAGSFSIDAYRTDFANQTVVDVDANPQQINFYNLIGKSYSNSLQAELNYELAKKLDVRLAYRWLDVKTTYHGALLEKPLTANHRAFINLAYETSNHFKFDLTTQWFSRKRLPITLSNPSDKQMGDYSPAFLQMTAQITKQFGKVWDVYIGGENLTNYTQQNLIVSAKQPFSPYFDGSIIWGPVNGRILYMGVRFRVL